VTGLDLETIKAQTAARSRFSLPEKDTILALVAEVEQLRESNDEGDQVRMKMADLLSRTAIALNGPEPELTMWSWHDLPEKADAAVRALDAIRDDATVEAMFQATTAHAINEFGFCLTCDDYLGDRTDAVDRHLAEVSHAAVVARIEQAGEGS